MTRLLLIAVVMTLTLPGAWRGASAQDEPPALSGPAPAPPPGPEGADPIDEPEAPPALSGGSTKAGAKPKATPPVEPGPGEEEIPKRDDLLKVQAPPKDPADPLPAAKEPPGGAAASPAGSTQDGKMPWILSPDRLPLAPSSAAVTVEVQAPATANVNKSTKFKIVVKNTGASPAMSVAVYDRLPEGLLFEKAEPAPMDPIGDMLVWQLDSLPAGAEKVITVTVKPTRTGDFDHAPTVRLLTGSRARTLVKEPKLKVEITQDESGKVLKGKFVTFAVHVTNNGSGTARNVIVHAKLSPGLKQEYGSEVEVKFKEDLGREALNSGESETLPLEVEAGAGGLQKCEVWAESADVTDRPEAHAEAGVEVVEPKLELKLKGSQTKYTDTVARYTLTISNPGTATAKNARAKIWLPLGGKLEAVPPGAKYGASDRSLFWPLGEIEPNAPPRELSFLMTVGGAGRYDVKAAIQADTCPRKDDRCTTEVVGMPDIKCTVEEKRRVLDVGEETVYEIHMKNVGSLDAKKLLVTAKLTDNMDLIDTSGPTKAASAAQEGQPRHDAMFTPFDLASGADQVLTLRVKATKKGTAICTVHFAHDEDDARTYSITTRVNEPN